MKISLMKYNKNFTRKFNKEKRFLSKFGNFEIYHVGSTAIKKIIGKGWIDVLIIVKDKEKQESLIKKLKDFGYVQGKTRQKYRKFLSIIKKNQQFNLHVTTKKDKKAYEQLMFCDFMNKNPDEAKNYERLKKKIYKKVNADREKYKLAKKAYIKGIMKLIK